jgi:PAS domain S-box-containing protein
MKDILHEVHILLDSTDDYYWTVDHCLRLQFCNDAYRQMLEQISGQQLHLGDEVLTHAFGPTTYAKWKDYYTRALSGESLCREEEFVHPLTGKRNRHIITIKPVENKQKEVVRLVCSSKNITAISSAQDNQVADGVYIDLLNESKDVICFIDEAGVFGYVNKAAEIIWGYSAEEITGRSFTEMLYQEDRAKTAEAIAAVMRGVKMMNFENRYVCKDGRLCSMLWSARWDESRRLMYCVGRDTIEKKQTEEALRLSDERFKALVQDGGDLISILDPEGNYQYVSPTAETILGIAPEEFIGKKAFDYIHPDDLPAVIRQFELLATEKRLQIPAFRFRNTDGDWRWIETVATNMLDHPAVGGIVTNSRDVTERMERERILQTSEDSYRTLFQSSPLPKWIYNLETLAIEDVNDTAIKHYGYSREEFLSMSIHDLRPVSELPHLLRMHEGMTDKIGVIDVGQLTHQTKDGTLIQVEMKAHKLVYQNRECIMVVCNDVTEKERYLEKLHASEQRLRIAASIANLGYWELDFASDILQWSDEIYSIWGRSKETFEVSYDAFFSTIHEDDQAMFAKEQGALLRGELLDFSHRIVLPDNSIRWVREKCRLVYDGNGKPKGLEGTVQDITQQIRLQKLVDDASNLACVGSWEIDMIHGSLTWTTKTHEIHETDERQFKPDIDNALKFYHPDYRDLITDKITFCISKGVPFDVEARIITQKGNERWVRAIGESEMMHGTCVRVYGSIQDIHDRKIAELRLQNMADNIPGVIFQYQVTATGTNRIQQLSKGCFNIWSVSPEAAMADNSLIWDQIKAGGDFQLLQESINRSAEKLEQWHCQFRNRSSDGTVSWLEGFGTPRRLPDGGTLWDSLIIDITELKIIESLLNDANELAQIGSWELNLMNKEGDSMYWSAVTRSILEVDDDYQPSLSGGFEFYEEPGRSQIRQAVEELMSTGKGFDLELLIKTGNENLKWVRCIGKGEFAEGNCVRIYGSFQDINHVKQTEVQLREVLGSISDAFYAVDENWQFTYFNKEAERLLKRNASDLIGKNIWTSFPTAGGTELEEIYRQVALTGISKSFEYYFPGDGGWYEVNAYPSNRGVSAYFKNIDERKQSAAALQKAYEEKTRIVESIGDAFFTMDRNFVVSYWNKAAEELIGVKREQLIGNNLWDVFPDAVSLPSYRNYHRVLETGESILFEDNYGTWLEVNAFPSEEGLTVFFRDISLRKEADLRLREAYETIEESERRYSDLFHLSPIPMWVYDIDTLAFLDVNEAAIRHYGYSREEFMQMTIHNIRPVEDWPQLDQALVKARQKDFTYKSGFFRHLKKNGEVIIVKVESDKIEYKRRRCAVVLVNDLTELLQTQESLENAYKNIVEVEEQEREKFAAEIHDGVAQNLVAIQMIFNNLLLSYPDLDSYFQSNILKETIEKAVVECRDIVNNVRPKELIDNGITAMIRQLMEKVSAAGNIHISFEPQGNLDQYFKYNELFHIYRIIQENLNNTLKYAKATEVYLKFELEKNRVVLFFSDNGIGISDELMHVPSSFLSIKRRIKVLQGEFFVYHNQPKGVKFKYHIPFNQETGSGN